MKLFLFQRTTRIINTTMMRKSVNIGLAGIDFVCETKKDFNY